MEAGRGELVIAQFLALTGLRGHWPMSSFDENGDTFDLSGQDRTLSYVGNPVYNYDGLIPYLRFDGVGDYLRRVDEAGLDITGTETYVGIPGLTLGGWFRPENVLFTQSIISKWMPAANFSYLLQLRGGTSIRFYISDNGVNFDSVDSTTGCNANTWYWMACRFNDADAGAELTIWLNEEQTTAATARNAIFSGAADFNIGSHNNGTSPYTGRASMNFLCAAALSDGTIDFLFQQTKAMYGV